MSQLEFNEDGTIKVPGIEKKQETPELDYLYVLNALNEIRFPVGKTLLIDFLQKNIFNKSIIKNHLDNLNNFGKLNHYSEEKIESLIDNLLVNGLIEIQGTLENKFHKVFFLTKKGKDEMQTPSLYRKKLSSNFLETKTEITEEDRKIFSELSSFLSTYNDEQKKAIISPEEKILCLAGAGSGKTTVLVKRIEFLVKYRSAKPESVLAITFTRKARQEMSSRLARLNLPEIKVETFNSFCEKLLKENSALIYGREMKVMSYHDKIEAIKQAINILKIDLVNAITTYFSETQRKNKTDEELIYSFVNDCFFILDYYKSKNQLLEDFSKTAEEKHKKSAKIIYSICKYIEEYMQETGLRDYTDQLLDAISLFKTNPEKTPKFEHILVDEYQDVNSSQVELLNLLNSKSLFCVGDPRQSIYGWRGSNISYILNFNKKYPSSITINLTKNYRSNNHIVALINASIKDMQLPDLEHNFEGEKKIQIVNFPSEEEEHNFVVTKIKESQEDKNEIFVLSRTNRQLKELSSIMKKEGISHVVRNDELKSSPIAKNGDITLATVHAIKGLEANTVFVIGCNCLNFPCRASEHPVIEMVKVEEYDKEEEEKRLFYVAMSRAREKLYLTYSGKKCTYFVNEDMKKIIQHKELENIFAKEASPSLRERLRKWRLNKAIAEEVPAYCIITDKTIQEIITKTPKDKRDLQDVYGLGCAKIAKYGDEILDMVS